MHYVSMHWGSRGVIVLQSVGFEIRLHGWEPTADWLCVTLGMFAALSTPQFSYLRNGSNNSSSPSWGFWEDRRGS